MQESNYYLTNPQEIYTVTELNATAREILEDSFPSIWVAGEVSNFLHHNSGHMYFSLKDETAQIKCAFFRNRNQILKFLPKNGLQVLVHAQVSLYEFRGDYQLIVEYMEEAGDGILRRAFEQLKNKLDKLGLFALENKKPIPALPKCVGIVTSPTGAAIQDILSVLKRRFSAIPIIIYPTQVQGEKAAPQIIKALETANKRQECDVLLLARGGGSLEDLWCFNDEALAYAIFQSKIPIISGIGHEIDVTIADFVADHRAATPSAAAELVSPSKQHWLENFIAIEKRLLQLINYLLKEVRQSVTSLNKQLRHPGQIIREKMQRLDYLEEALLYNFQSYLINYKTMVNELVLHLKRHNPLLIIKNYQEIYLHLTKRIQQAIKQILNYNEQKFTALVKNLEAVSPLATLKRGYAIVKKTQDQSIIRDVNQIRKGDSITAKVAKGSLECTVTKIIGDD